MAPRKAVNLYAADRTIEGSPDICIRCGRPAAVKPIQTMSTFQPSFFSFYVLLDVYSLMNWVIHAGESPRARVCTPFCSRHIWRLPLRFLSWLLVNLAIGAGVTFAIMRYELSSWAIAVGLAVWGVASAFWGVAVAAPPIPVLMITGEWVRLKVHPDYAAAVRQRQLARGEFALTVGPAPED